MLNTRSEFLNEASKKKIICFGAGKFLSNVIGFLEAENLKIEILIDNSPKNGGGINGLIIQPPDILSGCDIDEYIVLISTKYFAEEIENQIKTRYNSQLSIYKWPLVLDSIVSFDERLWYERIYKTCEELYKDIAKSRIDAESYLETKRRLIKDKSKVVVPRTPLMITTRCTLCCKECANLMPYFKKAKDYSAIAIMQWIDNICNAVDEWICCELVGGEPFLYFELSKVLSHALNKGKIQRVEITTNGSIIPSHDILNLLKNDKVLIKVSEYPNLIDYKKLTHIFDEYSICYEVLENMRWSRTGKLGQRNRNRLELQSQYLNCMPAKECKTILNGRLYVCSKAASLMELGFVNDFENVNLIDTDNLRERISYFLKLTYSRSCDCCDMASADEKLIYPAEQIKKEDISY